MMDIIWNVFLSSFLSLIINWSAATQVQRLFWGQNAKTADWLVDNDVIWPVLRNCACTNPRKLKIDWSMADEPISFPEAAILLVSDRDCPFRCNLVPRVRVALSDGTGNDPCRRPKGSRPLGTRLVPLDKATRTLGTRLLLLVSQISYAHAT